MSYDITRQQALERAPLLKAWGEGAKLQYNNGYEWIDCTELGSILSDGSPKIQYRIKPEPTLRPWKPEEVPVGALIKNKMMDVRELPATILNVIVNYHNIGDAIITDKPAHKSAYNHYFVSDLVTYHGGRYEDQMVYSLDHGKTWHPCGVVE